MKSAFDPLQTLENVATSDCNRFAGMQSKGNVGKQQAEIHPVVQWAQPCGDLGRNFQHPDSLTLVGIFNILIHYGALRDLAISKDASPAGPFIGIFLLVLSYLIFWFFIYRRGSGIAKWVFVVVTAVSVAMIPFRLGEVLAVGKIYAVIDGVAFALQLAALAMLFRVDGKAWLDRKGRSAAF